MKGLLVNAKRGKQYRNKQMTKIQRCLENQKRYSPSVKEKMFEVLEQIEDKKAFKKALGALMRLLEPFNICGFRGIMHEYEKECDQVRGQDIILLIGPTGCGKSTSCHYLAGSKMKKVKLKTKNGLLHHI